MEEAEVCNKEVVGVEDVSVSREGSIGVAECVAVLVAALNNGIATELSSVAREVPLLVPLVS